MTTGFDTSEEEIDIENGTPHREKWIITNTIELLRLNVFDNEICGSHLGYSDVVSKNIDKVILAGNI